MNLIAVIDTINFGMIAFLMGMWFSGLAISFVLGVSNPGAGLLAAFIGMAFVFYMLKKEKPWVVKG